MRKRKGDTLIEVAIAIAIFSLAAIGVVGVVHGSTSAAQAALEVTVTREEIDAQAETLRFIHNTYVTMGDSNSANYTRYEQLWQQIASRAVHTDTELNEILAFNPSSCAEIYNGTTLSKQKAFILNPRGVGAGLALNDVVVTPPGSGNGKFATAATTPRLLYNGVSGDQLLDAGENSALMSSLNSTYSTLSSAEGIYIVAVKDQGTTTMVSTDGAGNAEVHTGGAGYYDFYVRTCWYEPGAERPSTISTVIRLQDPAAADYGNAAVGNNAPGIRVFYYANATAAGGYVAPQFVNPGSSAMVQNGDGFTYADHAFVRWNTKADGTGTNYDPGNFILAPPGMTTRDTIILYAQWRDDRPASVIANIPTGTYVIKSSADLTKVMTVGGTLPGEYDLSAATLNGSDLQKWYIENLGSGVHRISAASNTGYVIDLKSASTANGNGLWSYAWNATCAQKWTVYLNPDNTYTFYSTCAGGSTMAITNDGPLRIHAFADQAVQKWVVEAPSAPVAPPVKYIQDYDVATCEKEASSAPVKVVDRRDDKEYTVRYINGNCWMTKDLAIFTSKGQPTGTITSTDSNFVNVDTWKLNATSSESYTEANAVAHSNGYGYNYCALMAGNGNSCDKYAAYTGDDDICPANWKVPSRNEIETVLGNSS
ncbi:RICIN domain-containing protein [Candidatus Saccharibacteria bacterium]|nr:RICIN domain-containing protein [Candidatus Saccharibacteria bacterium]